MIEKVFSIFIIFGGCDKLTSVKMLFSYNNNEKVVEVPVIPDELPDIIQEMQNESLQLTQKL